MILNICERVTFISVLTSEIFHTAISMEIDVKIKIIPELFIAYVVLIN
tara:strand:+ start:977 stop:1120 length:144 start_codon:yes stop_codon:yes gene_type:complete